MGGCLLFGMGYPVGFFGKWIGREGDGFGVFAVIEFSAGHLHAFYG